MALTHINIVEVLNKNPKIILLPRKLGPESTPAPAKNHENPAPAPKWAVVSRVTQTLLSSTLKSSSREFAMYPVHQH